MSVQINMVFISPIFMHISVRTVWWAIFIYAHTFAFYINIILFLFFWNYTSRWTELLPFYTIFFFFASCQSLWILPVSCFNFFPFLPCRNSRKICENFEIGMRHETFVIRKFVYIKNVTVYVYAGINNVWSIKYI